MGRTRRSSSRRSRSRSSNTSIHIIRKSKADAATDIHHHQHQQQQPAASTSGSTSQKQSSTIYCTIFNPHKKRANSTAEQGRSTSVRRLRMKRRPSAALGKARLLTRVEWKRRSKYRVRCSSDVFPQRGEHTCDADFMMGVASDGTPVIDLQCRVMDVGVLAASSCASCGCMLG